MKNNKWLQSEEEQLILLVNENLNVNQISLVLTTKTKSQIREKIYNLNLCVKLEKKKWNKKEDDLLVSLAKDGKGKKEIAKILNRKLNAVSIRASFLKVKIYSSRNWSEQEILQLKNLVLQGLGNTEIGKIINRDHKSICSKKKDLQILPDRFWSKEEIEILENFYIHYGAKYCQDLLKNRKIGKQAIIKYANKLGLKREKSWKQSEINELINLHKDNRSVYEISCILNKTTSSVSHKMFRLKLKSNVDVLNTQFDYAPDERFKGDFKDFIRKKFSNAKNTCKKFNFEFSIDEEFLFEMWKSQNGKCFYSGKQMEIFSSAWAASIDRIDSKQGYTKKNVVLCCGIFNRMKLNYSVKDFINLCQMVTNFNK